jgi:hypothetical protein
MEKKMTKSDSDKKEVGSVFDLLGRSFEIVKKNWQAFAVVNTLALLSALFSIGNKEEVEIPKNATFEQAVVAVTGYDVDTFLSFFIPLAIVLLALSIFLYAMMTILEVESTAGKKPSISHLFDKAKGYWLRLFGLLILSAVIVIAGFILLIVPGIIALVLLVMAPFFMVDKNMGIIESLKASVEMGKKHFWKVFAAILLTFIIAIGTMILDDIPAIGSLIGVIVTIAFSLIIPLRYQQLKKIS